MRRLSQVSSTPPPQTWAILGSLYLEVFSTQSILARGKVNKALLQEQLVLPGCSRILHALESCYV